MQCTDLMRNLISSYQVTYQVTSFFYIVETYLSLNSGTGCMLQLSIEQIPNYILRKRESNDIHLSVPIHIKENI